jgi:hypothetical protein
MIERRKFTIFYYKNETLLPVLIANSFSPCIKPDYFLVAMKKIRLESEDEGVPSTGEFSTGPTFRSPVKPDHLIIIHVLRFLLFSVSGIRHEIYGVADPDPGSGPFLAQGTGIRNNFFQIPDPIA